jgi:hypothetical protein
MLIRWMLTSLHQIIAKQTATLHQITAKSTTLHQPNAKK